MSAPLDKARGDRKGRRLRTKLLAIAVGCSAALLLVEIAARLLITEDPRLRGHSIAEVAFHESIKVPSNDDHRWAGYELDRELGFRLAANLDTEAGFAEAPGGHYRVRTNALALRDDRPLTAKHAKRVLVLGDSMTFGIGVERERAFPAVLEKKLGAPFEVVNAGCCMWGQCEETAFLEHRAAALAPAVVVLEITIANDPLDDVRYSDPYPDGTLAVDSTLGKDLQLHPVFRVPFLPEHSRAYRALVWNVGRHIIRYRAMKEPWRLERAAVLVRRAKALSEKLGAKLAIVVAPTAAQLEHSLADRILATHEINDFFLRLAQQEGIPACDPTVHLQAVYARGHSPYFAIDKHWNPEGHEAVATALAPLVTELAK